MYDDEDVVLMPNNEVQQMAHEYQNMVNSGCEFEVMPQTEAMAR